MNGATQQLDHSRAASARRWSMRAWKPDHRAGKKPEGHWHDLPSGFLDALKIAEPFVGRDRSSPYFMGVLLDGEHAYATDNFVLIETAAGGGVPTAMIPLWLIRLLTKRPDPPWQIHACPHSIAVAWKDGTWISGAPCPRLPASVIARFEDWQEPRWPLSAEWKRDFRMVARLSEQSVVIEPDRMSGGRGQSEVEVKVATPVQGVTAWHPSVLGRVIKIADRIDFSSWPEPACFAFASGRGFVASKV